MKEHYLCGLYWIPFLMGFVMSSTCVYYLALSIVNLFVLAIFILRRSKVLFSREFVLLTCVSLLIALPSIMAVQSALFVVKWFIVMISFWCLDNLHKQEIKMAFFIMPIMVCLAVCPLLMDNRDMEITIRFGNTGLFSTFMSYVAIIYVQSRNLKINKTEIMILLIVFSVIFLLFKSRTSILILSLGLFSTLLRRKVNVQFCKILGVALLLIFSIVTYSFFNENKYNSACGRLLIQKVCALNLKHVPIMGYGLNSFSRVYPLLQEKYYREGNMTEQENRLAGDVRYAFNEFVQIFFEFGILGIMVVFLFLFFIIKWHQTGFLFVILPPLLFSYPLHNDYLIFIILYLWVNYSHTSNEKEVQPSCGCVL